MIQYRIIKTRFNTYKAERKQGVFSYWEYLGTKETYDEAMSVVEEERTKDSEGLPKIVWWSR